MYLDFLVKVPTVKGKITRRKKLNVVYIEYEYDRVYDPSRKYTFPKRVTIGKLSDTDPELMKPNQNFLKYFPDAELPESKNRTSRSSCLRVGAYFVLRKLIEECSLKDILGKYFGSCDMGLFLDLAVYSIIAENNAAQYYPDYTYNHPLFTEKMKQYSDSTVSDFLNSVTDDQSTGFLNTWNESRNYREKIYISYDSTNKNCQAGDIKMVEFGHPKVDMGEPVFNYAVAYDTHNQEPLFYEKYPGSLNDISQLQFMLDKASGYGYKKIGFILDRGYFSCENIQYMDKCGYSFVIMVKGMSALVNELILENKGTFENKRVNNIYEYGVYGKTIRHKLYAGDKKERYFHLYHSISKESVKCNSRVECRKRRDAIQRAAVEIMETEGASDAFGNRPFTARSRAVERDDGNRGKSRIHGEILGACQINGEIVPESQLSRVEDAGGQRRAGTPRVRALPKRASRCRATHANRPPFGVLPN